MLIVGVVFVAGVKLDGRGCLYATHAAAGHPPDATKPISGVHLAGVSVDTVPMEIEGEQMEVDPSAVRMREHEVEWPAMF